MSNTILEKILGGLKMGEIIFSLFIGGWMIFTGAFLIFWLNKEEKSIGEIEKDGES